MACHDFSFIHAFVATIFPDVASPLLVMTYPFLDSGFLVKLFFSFYFGSPKVTKGKLKSRR